jgi:hypothetical protein
MNFEYVAFQTVTGYGMQVSLNPRKMAEIEGIIKDP